MRRSGAVFSSPLSAISCTAVAIGAMAVAIAIALGVVVKLTL